ncbi:SDR family NAD(P)-dependent oxidoreductase [Pedobacter sp. Leaf194]|uniref:SDR family NAD(P)-dependent oxidoreductase n=1 Tax=Pedobacter sp. Leaf194 TaxID=1736297 RepID=UPI0007026310|nr:SDR family NAD(P)-dependent oxidoreductase [Pedobacter sp. Leaf194]KQS41799.1 hypothetical protein ASG14_04960 [Pedobacter sp. Leaf194]
MENKNSTKPVSRSWSLRKKIIVSLSIPLSLFLLFYLSVILLFVKSDTSKDTPLYRGRIIPDTLQTPLNNSFGHFTEPLEIVKDLDLKGKIIVMTGAHTGTGKEAAKAFISKGATVVALTNDVDWAEKNLKGLPRVEIEYLDLQKAETIDAFTRKFLVSGRQIDVLINSAGIHNTPLQRDVRGYERQFSVNVLGHFALTLKLLPALKKANGARIVNLSSRGHRLNGVQFGDINFNHTKYEGMRSYAQTKTALALLSVKEDEMFKRYNIRAFAVHPGPIPTTDLFAGSLVGYASGFKFWYTEFTAKCLRTFWGTEIMNFLRKPKNEGDKFKTVKQGGSTTAWASFSPQLKGKGGLYLEDCNIAPIVPNGSDAPFGVRPWALERKAADKIWDICQRMTGVYYRE